MLLCFKTCGLWKLYVRLQFFHVTYCHKWRYSVLLAPCSRTVNQNHTATHFPLSAKMSHHIVNLNMHCVETHSQKLTLLPRLHLTMLTTSWNKQWSTNLIQIFKNCRKLKANPYPCQQLRTLCYTWLINCVVNMTVVFGQWPFDVHSCFCFVLEH